MRDFTTSGKRREALEKTLKIKLSHIGKFSFDEKIAGSRNCENMIGAAQIPLGVAGPLKLRAESGELRVGNYYLPLATTEGALVASISRGCKAITESGGAHVYSYNVGTSRGPVFYTGGLENEKKLFAWVKKNEDKMKKAAAKTSKHIALKKVSIRGVGQYAFVRFSYDTQDAMGMNMVTIATEEIAKLVEKETGIACLSIAGNFDIDKKAAWVNFINARGHKAWAEVVIPKKVLKNVLKTNSQKLFDVWLAKCMIGSAMSGSMGFNAHFANVVAALFLATGQDAAHVVEGSMGITTAKVLKNGDLYVSVYLPSLLIGTVGGGTALATQKECLEMLGVAGGASGKNAQKFAEIIAGAVLAGEVSLLASLSVGSLGKSHQELARGGK